MAARALVLALCAAGALAWRYEQHIVGSGGLSKFGNHLSTPVEFKNGTMLFAVADQKGVSFVREGRSYHSWKLHRTALPITSVKEIALSEAVAIVGATANGTEGYAAVLDTASGRLVATLSPFVYGDQFGQSVAVDCDGEVVAVGMPSYNTTGSVAVYSEESSWAVPHVISAPSTVTNVEASFGASIALGAGGKRLVVGAPSASTTHGSVYIYEYDNDTSDWLLAHSLHGNAAAIGAGTTAFGYSVEMNCDGRTLVVGAPCISQSSCAGTLAAAYIFVRSSAGTGPANWTLLHRLPDADKSLFGSSLCLDPGATGGSGLRLAVGEPYGHVRVYNVKSGKLAADVSVSGAKGSGFGEAVSLRGDILAVGEPFKNRVKMFSVEAPSEVIVGAVLAVVLLVVLGAVLGLLVCYKLHPSTHLALSNAARV